MQSTFRPIAAAARTRSVALTIPSLARVCAWTSATPSPSAARTRAPAFCVIRPVYGPAEKALRTPIWDHLVAELWQTDSYTRSNEWADPHPRRGRRTEHHRLHRARIAP